MAPTLVASYNVVTSSVDTSTLTTPSFTPTNGEVIVVKLSTWDSGTSMGTPAGGSQTYTKRSGSTSGGFRPFVAVYTAVISGSPGSMTVSSTPSASSWHSMVVERWSGAQLAGSPIGDQADGAAAPASDTVASLTAGSIWSWVASDAQSVSPSGHAYLASATQELLDDQSGPANGVTYYAYQTATSGTNSYGLSTPSGMQFWIAGVEIQASGGGGTDADANPSTVTATAAVGTVSLRTDEKASPSTVAATAAVGTATAHGGANPTVSTVAATAAVGSVSVKTGSAASPSTVAATAAVGSPAVTTPAAPATVAATTTVGSPSIHTGQTVTVTTVAAVASIGTPSVTAGGSATASPATVAAVATVGTATVHTGQTVTVAKVAGVASVGAPQLRTGSTATVVTVASRASVAAPTVTASTGGPRAGRLTSSTAAAGARSVTAAASLASTT